MDRFRQSFYYLFVTTKVLKVNRAKNECSLLCTGLIVLAYIGYSLPFGDGSVKSCAHVLNDVSITVLKKLKFYRSFHHYLMHKENVFWKLL